jgi:hypothetical protein
LRVCAATIRSSCTARIGDAEARQDRRQQRNRDRVGGGDAQFAARLHVASGDAALEVDDRIGHRARQPDHFLARCGRPIAGARTLEQARADRGFDGAEATKDRRVVEAERLGRADQRARVGDRLDQPKFIPVQ